MYLCSLVNVVRSQWTRSFSHVSWQFQFDQQIFLFSLVFFLQYGLSTVFCFSFNTADMTRNFRNCCCMNYFQLSASDVQEYEDQWIWHSDMVSQITMKRRPLLYIVNFLLPVLFFLCLDLASFLISDSGGEKLSFKVTVLLAVTVLQLILNEILPATSSRIPLIGKETGYWVNDKLFICIDDADWPPPSGLLHWELCSDADEPLGDNRGDAPDGERCFIPGCECGP